LDSPQPCSTERAVRPIVRSCPGLRCERLVLQKWRAILVFAGLVGARVWLVGIRRDSDLVQKPRIPPARGTSHSVPATLDTGPGWTLLLASETHQITARSPNPGRHATFWTSGVLPGRGPKRQGNSPPHGAIVRAGGPRTPNPARTSRSEN